MEASASPRVLTRAADVPGELVDEVVADMAERMDRSDAAQHCGGLSFAFVFTDRRLPEYRYAVGDDGEVTLTRDDATAATFTFSGASDTFDAVLRGHSNALKALLTGRVRLHGSMWHIRELLRMMPVVERAYGEARSAMIRRHRDRYDFRF
jgi:putative sterol carrier protein